jgi:putative addiction module killer protein
MYTVEHYQNLDTDRNFYQEWVLQLRDKVAKVAILKRVVRLREGNFGDHKFCRDGVSELRIDVGAGYRVYYAVAGKEIILLLCGGDKRTQGADIDRACANWKDWQSTRNRSLQ